MDKFEVVFGATAFFDQNTEEEHICIGHDE